MVKTNVRQIILFCSQLSFIQLQTSVIVKILHCFCRQGSLHTPREASFPNHQSTSSHGIVVMRRCMQTTMILMLMPMRQRQSAWMVQEGLREIPGAYKSPGTAARATWATHLHWMTLVVERTQLLRRLVTMVARTQLLRRLVTMVARTAVTQLLW